MAEARLATAHLPMPSGQFRLFRNIPVPLPDETINSAVDTGLTQILQSTLFRGSWEWLMLVCFGGIPQDAAEPHRFAYQMDNRVRLRERWLMMCSAVGWPPYIMWLPFRTAVAARIPSRRMLGVPAPHH